MLLHALAGARRRRRHVASASGLVVGLATLLVCCRVLHSIRRAQRSCLERNTQQHAKQSLCWSLLTLNKLLPHTGRPAPSEVRLLSCSWLWVLLRDLTLPALSDLARPWRRNPAKMLSSLMLAALLCRGFLLYLRHLQHADTDTSEPRRYRHLDSLSRTARCTFSAHREDLFHLLQVLSEETVAFWEGIADNVRYYRELARVMNLLGTWLMRYIKMLLAKAFVKGYKAGYRRGLKAGRAAGFVAGTKASSLEAYTWGWKKGYEQGHRRSFRQGEREGFEKGYNDGYDKGKAEGKTNGSAKR